MRLETSRGGAFDADLVFPINAGEYLLIQLRESESRPLSAVAADFEGLTGITCEDGRDYSEYTDLRAAARMGQGAVQLHLYK